MKINWMAVFIFVLLAILVFAFYIMYLVGTRVQSQGSYIDNLADQGTAAIYHGKIVPVIVINVNEDKVHNSNAEDALLRGDLYLLMENMDEEHKIFFNDIPSFQQLDNSRAGVISIENPVYLKLEVGQFSHGGVIFQNKSLEKAGVRAIRIYSAIKQDNTYGEVIGEAVMANGGRFPIQLVEVNSKYLGL